MKIFIAGYNGFTGSDLTRIFSAGQTIVKAPRSELDFKHERVSY